MTGGTGDVSPQQFTQTITLSAPNTFTQAESGIPMIRLPVRKGRSIVLELLRVELSHPALDTQPAVGGTTAASSWQISTISKAAVDATDPRVLAVTTIQWRGAFTAAGSFESVTHLVKSLDFTDSAGHGLLVATDSLFFGATTLAFTGSAVFVAKVWYRFKEVALEEYIGIVQSQQ